MVSKGETASVEGDLECNANIKGCWPSQGPTLPTGDGLGSGSKQAAYTQVTPKLSILTHKIPLDFPFWCERLQCIWFSFTGSLVYFSLQSKPAFSIRDSMTSWAYTHLSQDIPIVHQRWFKRPVHITWELYHEVTLLIGAKGRTKPLCHEIQCTVWQRGRALHVEPDPPSQSWIYSLVAALWHCPIFCTVVLVVTP